MKRRIAGLAVAVGAVMQLASCDGRNAPTHAPPETAPSTPAEKRVGMQSFDIVGRLESLTEISDPKWLAFRGVYVFTIVRSLSVPEGLSGSIATGRKINVVVTKHGVESQGVVETRMEVGELRVGGEYHLSLTADLPPSWSAIQSEFDDPRIGLAAAPAVASPD